MADKKSLALRAKIIGVLLRDARLAAGKTPHECAELLGLHTSTYNTYELGAKPVSLPELELLAYYFDIPLSHFWGEDIISDDQERTSNLKTAEIITLRQRIIGTTLREARLKRDMSQKELAASVGVTPARIKAYEFGEEPVPIPVLEALGWVLGLRIDSFFEASGPVGEWDANRRAFEKFKDLPPEVRDFVSNPANELYMRVAMRLAGMPTEKLRDVAATILDITF
jgi:transcriptional regulator with XRE-family HTH domain